MQLPRGTHQWSSFLTPEELVLLFNRAALSVRQNHRTPHSLVYLTCPWLLADLELFHFLMRGGICLYAQRRLKKWLGSCSTHWQGDGHSQTMSVWILLPSEPRTCSECRWGNFCLRGQCNSSSFSGFSVLQVLENQGEFIEIYFWFCFLCFFGKWKKENCSCIARVQGNTNCQDRGVQRQRRCHAIGPPYHGR